MASSAELAVRHCEKYRGMTFNMLKGVPVEKYTAQAPGAMNHFLWTVGHLAVGYSFFGKSIGAAMPEVPERYAKLFGMGSKPTGNAADYPSMEEIRAFSDKCFAVLAAHARKLSDADLAAPCDGGGGGFLSDKIDAILTVGWHEGWHSGQLAALRGHLGVGSVFGG